MRTGPTGERQQKEWPTYQRPDGPRTPATLPDRSTSGRNLRSWLRKTGDVFPTEERIRDHTFLRKNDCIVRAAPRFARRLERGVSGGCLGGCRSAAGCCSGAISAGGAGPALSCCIWPSTAPAVPGRHLPTVPFPNDPPYEVAAFAGRPAAPAAAAVHLGGGRLLGGGSCRPPRPAPRRPPRTCRWTLCSRCNKTCAVPSELQVGAMTEPGQ